MKNWERYQEYLERGDFHVHTNYTEGSSTVSEMCEQAIMNNLSLIAFTEHVRKNLSYDFDSLLKEIKRARKLYPKLRILSGCEAAVRDREGSIDVSQEVLDKSDIVVASFHSFPYGRKQDFLKALHKMLRNPRVDIWGHPITFLRNINPTPSEIQDIIRSCIENKVLIERSLSPIYLTPSEFLRLAQSLGATIVTNSDAHSREDLKKA
jgi:DNA polymerase (family 10)/putative hydrolase